MKYPLHILGYIFVISAVFMSLPVESVEAQSPFALENRSRPQQFIFLRQNSPIPLSGRIRADGLNAQWFTERVPGTGFIRIKSRLNPRLSLHIEHGRLQAGAAPPNWFSAHWQFVAEPNTPYFRIRNRWKPNVYIHNHNGPLVAGPMRHNLRSTHWQGRPVVRNRATNKDVISLQTVIDVAKRAHGSLVETPQALRKSHKELQELRRRRAQPQQLPRVQNQKPGTRQRFKSGAKKAGRAGRRVGGLIVNQGIPTKVPFSQGLKAAQYTGDICWKDSYPRGVGTIPRNCSANQQNDGLLCYRKCNRGYKGAATMCLPRCPRGFTDTGLHCFKPKPVKRAAFTHNLFKGDRLGSLDGARARCRRSRLGRKYGCVTANSSTIVYSRCPRGYKQAPVVTNLCTPVCPRNTIDIGISCQMKTYDRGIGRLRNCNRGQQRDAGLCYPFCKKGFDGIGPVCWAQKCPAKFPVNCGASCAVSKNACIQSVANQVMAPIEVVTNIAGLVLTGGAANAAKTAAVGPAKMAAKIAAKAGTRAAIKASLKRQAKAIGKELAESALENAAETMYEASQTGEFDYVSLDPTGIAAVVVAYAKPLCADVK